MRFVVVTGMSGSGKSTALNMLEDRGYFCVDNMPVKLVEKFAELTVNPSSEISKVAMGIDVRSGQDLSQLSQVLEDLEKSNIQCEILFLDATDDILIKRYKETRRQHPLAKGDSIEKGIQSERRQLEFLKRRADYIIDTSNLLTRELKKEIEKIFIQDKKYKNLFVTVLSFGFKYGIPADADLVFDVRFMPNPYYEEDLKHKTGNDKEVRDFVMKSKVSQKFMKQLTDMISFLIPNYMEEGKTQLVIAVGCTGGKHRSVTVAKGLYDALNVDGMDYGLKIEHRDIYKDSMGNKIQ